MSTSKELWRKLSKSKKYREEFVASQLKRGIPFQIRALMKQRGWSQEDLAAHAGLQQGVVSRAANPNYGNLTLNTIIRIAAGFDVAFIGQFVPFSELGRWFINLSEGAVQVPAFNADTGFARTSMSDNKIISISSKGEIESLSNSSPEVTISIRPPQSEYLEFPAIANGSS